MNPVKVHVLAEDGRVREAARALPQGYQVTLSRDMESALEDVAKNGGDIAVVDLALNGFAFAKDMQSNPKTSHIRVIMICERPEDKWLSEQAGAVQVLLKPLSDPGILVEAIEAAMSGEKRG